MHPLQDLFATAEGERSFDDRLHALFEAGDLAAAEALLTAELATLDGEIARLCRELPREAVTLDGWEDLAEAIDLHEGDPVTGITLAIANDPDLAFDKGRLQEPFVTIGLHTDETYAFSSATPAALLAEARAAEGAAWDGHEEDIELYLEVSGFGPLNTALLGHIQRHFLRDGSAEPAPLSYVDYVIGCWWRALRFQQAIATECTRHGVPGGAPVVASTVDMRPELTTVHIAAEPAARPARRAEAPRMADLAHILEAVQIERTPLVVEIPPAAEMELVEEPTPVADAALGEETVPVEEIVPIEEATPVEDTVLFAESVPAADATPFAEAAPAETTPAEEPAPLVETVSIEDPVPLADAVPAEEAEPFLEPAPVEEVATVEEATAWVETAPVEVVVPFAEAAPIDEMTPVAEAAEPLELNQLEELDEEEEEEEPASAQMAEISPARFIARKPIEEEAKPTGTGLRRRFAESEPVEKPARKWGFLSRLFGRSQSYDEAA